jgi:hypothetical protein
MEEKAARAELRAEMEGDVPVRRCYYEQSNKLASISTDISFCLREQSI